MSVYLRATISVANTSIKLPQGLHPCCSQPAPVHVTSFLQRSGFSFACLSTLAICFHSSFIVKVNHGTFTHGITGSHKSCTTYATRLITFGPICNNLPVIFHYAFPDAFSFWSALQWFEHPFRRPSRQRATINTFGPKVHPSVNRLYGPVDALYMGLLHNGFILTIHLIYKLKLEVFFIPCMSIIYLLLIFNLYHIIYRCYFVCLLIFLLLLLLMLFVDVASSRTPEAASTDMPFSLHS